MRKSLHRTLYLRKMQPILLLHGAIGAADQLLPLKNQLSNQFDVHVFNFAGHGGKTMAVDAFSIPFFAAEVNGYLEQHQLDNVIIFGYSMGGYVGMYLAKNSPEKVLKLITLATKFHWTPEIAAREIQMIQPEKIATKLPAFATTLKERHAPNDWNDVLNKTANMLEALGKHNTLQPDDYSHINIPCLLLVGDRDKMIGLAETLEVFNLLPQAQLGILPATPHPIEQVNQEVLTAMIRTFI